MRLDSLVILEKKLANSPVEAGVLGRGGHMKTNNMDKSKRSRRMVLAAVLAAIILGLPMTLYISAAISQSKKQSHSGQTNITTDIAPAAIAEENGAATDSAQGVQSGAMRRTVPVHASAARWTGDGAPYRNDPTGADYWLDTMTDGAAALDSRATAPSRSNLAAYPGFGDHRSSLNGRPSATPLPPPPAAAGMPQNPATPGSGPSAMPIPPGGAIQPAARPMDGLPPFGEPGNPLDPFAPDNPPANGNPFQPNPPAPAPVPEPATILMLAVGLLGIVAASARHTKRRGRQTPDPSNH